MFHFLLIGTSWSRTSSVVAWNDTASKQPISCAVRAISDTTPLVDRVMRRRPRAMPSLSITTFIASRTLSKLYSGSPMPISTMLLTRRVSSLGAPGVGHSSRSSRASMTWPTISAAVRLRTSFFAGMAEGTSQRAADLRRNAQRAAIGFRDIDGLDLMPAGDADQIFAGAIFGDLFGDDLWHLKHEILGQQGAVILGKVRHAVKIAHAPVVNPLPDLPHAHLGLLFRRACGDQRGAHLVAGHADQIGLAALGQLARDGQHILGDWRGHSGRP